MSGAMVRGNVFSFGHGHLQVPATSGKVIPKGNRHPTAPNRAQPMMRREGFLRVKEAAQLLDVAPNTVRAWGAAGKIPEYRHPVNRYRLYKKADLDRLL